MHHDIKQGEEEWWNRRGGKLTSSELHKAMANYGKAFGDPAKQLAVNIAVEQITGRPINNGHSNDHMDRGTLNEPIAGQLYALENFCTVRRGGFYDFGFFGLSPDGLVGDDGIIEIKDALPHIHYARIKRGAIDPAYKWQCYANLKFPEKAWLDFVSHCTEFPEGKRLYVCRIRPEHLQKEFAMIDQRIAEFQELVEETREAILSGNYRVESGNIHDKEGV
jgi:hypothetical protein